MNETNQGGEPTDEMLAAGMAAGGLLFPARARDVYLAMRAAAPSRSAAWRTVPVEPTDAMLDEAVYFWGPWLDEEKTQRAGRRSDDPADRDRARAVWAQMLSATLSPREQPEPVFYIRFDNLSDWKRDPREWRNLPLWRDPAHGRVPLYAQPSEQTGGGGEDAPSAWAVEAEKAASDAYAANMGDPDGNDDTAAAKSDAALAIERIARRALKAEQAAESGLSAARKYLLQIQEGREVRQEDGSTRMEDWDADKISTLAGLALAALSTPEVGNP